MKEKKIIFSTLRNNKGATGGPGGVLYMLKTVVGDKVDGYSCSYRFNTFKKLNRLTFILNRFFFLIKALFDGDAYYIVHDIKSAQLLSYLGKKYSLVFHQQGPSVFELMTFGKVFKEREKKNLEGTERRAFTKAFSLHFPSKGAEDIYFESPFRTCERTEVNLGKPLYNTIPEGEICPIEGINEDKDTLTFFSLGTLTKSKGQLHVIDFFEKFLPLSRKNVRYFVVGDGPLKEELLIQWNGLEKKYFNFKFKHFERLPHEKVMYLHKIADVYIMLHELSIFDFATLEAMDQNTAIVLSDIGGNLDFDKQKNVIFASGDYSHAAQELASAQIERLKKLNKETFDRFFSKEAFKSGYVSLIKDCVGM